VSGPVAIVPVGLRVEGRSILVVGAGRIAARKAKAYLDQGAVVTVVAPEHRAEMDALPVEHRIRREFRPDDLDDQWLVVTATGDPSVDGAVFRAAERRRIWCNAADDPANCSVILPAVSRAGDLTVAISSGGTSPATASWLRRRIDSILDDDTLAVAATCSEVRDEVRAAGLPTEVDGWADVLDREALDLVAAGRGDILHDRLLTAVVGRRA
jgi:precorrin-2 dehydrogenase